MAMSDQKNEQRINLLKGVKNPLDFFTLALLIIETLIVCLVLITSGTDRTFLLKAGIGILVLLILLVAILSVYKIEVLVGDDLNNEKIIFLELNNFYAHTVIEPFLGAGTIIVRAHIN